MMSNGDGVIDHRNACMMSNRHLKGNGDGVIDHRKVCMMSNEGCDEGERELVVTYV